MKYVNLSLLFLLLKMGVGMATISWDLPASQIFSSPESDVKQAQIAIQSNDIKACVVFVTSQEHTFNIEAMSYDGGNWTSSTPLGTAFELPLATVGINEKGESLVIWDSYQHSNLQLESAFFDGNQWNSLSSFQNLGANYYPCFPNLTFNENGYGVATWISEDNQVVGNTFSPSTVTWFESPYPLSENGLSVYPFPYPFAIASDQSVVGLVPTVTGIWSASFDATNPIDSFKNALILPNEIESTPLKITRNPQTGQSISIFQLLQQNLLISGDTLSPSNWNFLPIFPLLYNSLSFDIGLNVPLEEAVCIWNMNNGAIQTAVLKEDAWSAPLTLSTDGYMPVISVFKINGSSTHAVALWIDLSQGSEHLTIQTSEYSGETDRWSLPIPLSDTSSLIENPRVAVNSQGFVMTCWDRLVQTETGLHTVLESVTGQVNEAF